jgi:hypothetical protein
VKITGDETAGGTERERNIKALMDGKAKVGIITIAAGAEALNLQDKIGAHPRVSYIVSTPYTASTAKQVMGRGFRLGSESSAEILWLFNDTPSDRTIATNMAWLSRMMGAAVSGEVENPNADDLERFMFPELDRNASNGGTARDMADDFDASDRLILESPPDRAAVAEGDVQGRAGERPEGHAEAATPCDQAKDDGRQDGRANRVGRRHVVRGRGEEGRRAPAGPPIRDGTETARYGRAVAYVERPREADEAVRTAVVVDRLGEVGRRREGADQES